MLLSATITTCPVFFPSGNLILEAKYPQPATKTFNKVKVYQDISPGSKTDGTCHEVRAWFGVRLQRFIVLFLRDGDQILQHLRLCINCQRRRLES